MTDGRQEPARRLARHVSSLCPPPKRAKNKSSAHIFGGCLRRPSSSWLSMSLGLVNTAPNCRLNFSPMSTPGAKAALKHYYDCDAPFSPPVRPAPRSRDPKGLQTPRNFIFEVVAVGKKQKKIQGNR